MEDLPLHEIQLTSQTPAPPGIPEPSIPQPQTRAETLPPPYSKATLPSYSKPSGDVENNDVGKNKVDGKYWDPKYWDENRRRTRVRFGWLALVIVVVCVAGGVAVGVHAMNKA